MKENPESFVTLPAETAEKSRELYQSNPISYVTLLRGMMNACQKNSGEIIDAEITRMSRERFIPHNLQGVQAELPKSVPNWPFP